MGILDLTGKTILVTGASSGIGKQTAVTLSECGADVVITGRNRERLLETAGLLHGASHLVFQADLSVQTNIQSLVEQLPVLDGVVFSAGITTHMPARFIKNENIDEIFKINYTSTVLLVSSILKMKKIKEKSSLVFLSSTATKYAYFGGALYTGSKAALEAYCRVLAVELAPKGIRCNCLSPNFVNTPMVDGAASSISEEVLDRFRKASPLGFGEPEDVANTIAFFLSDGSRWITGTNLVLGAIFT